jgi:hypothetical protein
MTDQWTKSKLLVLGMAIGVAAVACQPENSAQDTAANVDEEAMLAEARELTGQFVGTLQPTLQQAMQSGGPVHAIDVCAIEAPQIAAGLSEDSEWQVTRVSLRARNVETATPDDWERQMLMEFDQRQEAGEEGAAINVAATVDGEFRYLQAQAAAPLCLTCHGVSLSEDVQAALANHYPDDMATGYLAGEIRGAISLRRPL